MSTKQVIQELEEQLRYATGQDDEYAKELREAIDKLKKQEEEE
jgi:hypothetical protein